MFHHLVQVVRDEHNGLVLFPLLIHDLVQELTAFQGKSRTRFVNDQDVGFPVHALRDLDDLAHLHVQAAGAVAGSEFLDTKFVQ